MRERARRRERERERESHLVPVTAASEVRAIASLLRTHTKAIFLDTVASILKAKTV